MRLFCKCGSRTAHLGKLWIKIFMTIIVIYAMVSALKSCTAIAQEGIEIEKRTYMKSLMCAKHEDLTGNLLEQHKEIRKWWAINSNNEVVELFVNDENGAWTIVITNNEKFSCALIGGDSGANYSEDFK